MEIVINQKAQVRCSDGKCYPCVALIQITDFYHILPSVYIEFIDLRPADVIAKRITVTADRIIYEEQGDGNDG